MALKPITTEKAFVEGAGVKKTLPLPRRPRVKKLSDEEATFFKGLLFGPTGSGKTRAILGLLLHGFKVMVISTDIGGEGLSTVKLALKTINHLDLLDHCSSVVLSNYTEILEFLNNPASVYPEIYDEGIDWLIWDGFSGFQQNALADEIGSMTPQRSENGKEVSDARESGLQFEQQDWGMVKTGTLRNLDKFLKLHNLKTGQVWHKIVTCLEEMKASKGQNGTVWAETREPLIQGAAKKLIGPAFDLILNTRIVSSAEDKKREFKYICVGHDQLAGAKTRGLELPPVMDGDMYKLWATITEQMGYKKGAVVESLKEEVAVGSKTGEGN